MLAYIANKYVALQWIHTANVMIKKKSLNSKYVQVHSQQLQQCGDWS